MPHTWKEWPDATTRYDKTSSDLLLDGQGNVLAWGHSVLTTLSQLRSENKAIGKTRLRAYKMKLRDDTQSSTGPEYSPVDVVSKYLKCMKDYALYNIRRSVGELHESEIRWVLTVPAIWREVEKRRMLDAAHRAGFPDDDARLILALEPEAAALYCQSSAEVLRSNGGLPPGTRFMIVDAGGGTVDLTTHEVLEGGGLRELVAGSGCPCGSTVIDKHFMRYLNRRMMPDVVKTFQKQDPIAYLDLMSTWERTKCNPNVNSEVRFIEIPGRLLRLLSRDAPDVLKSLASEQNGEDTKLLVKREHFRELFRPVLDEVIAAVNVQFENLAPARGMRLSFHRGRFCRVAIAS